MMDYIDYDPVAKFYDSYVATTYDHAFFLSRVSEGAKVLELTSGTGRLSIPLARAGVELTCVDISQRMLDELTEKLKKNGLKATLHCTDVQYLKYSDVFDTAILPFQSFMELVGREKQLNCLRSVHRALKANGVFYCTMHNPAVRRISVDGVLRGVGAFKHGQETVVVSGFELGGDPVVKRSQFIEHYDKKGQLKSRIHQAMEFELIEAATFRKMATDVGFQVDNIYGSYDGQCFDAEKSPVMIWELRKGDNSPDNG